MQVKTYIVLWTSSVWSLTDLTESKPSPLLYRGTIVSVLSSCITTWYSICKVSDRKRLQRIVKTEKNIIGMPLPYMDHSHSCHVGGDTSASKPDQQGCSTDFTSKLSGSSTPYCTLGPPTLPH